MEESMLSEIRSTYFSLNLDEATSSSYHRVFKVLVSYLNQGKKEVACDHLASINAPAVTTENLLNTLINLLKEKSIPWKNLLATLMDWCNVIQGSKNGLEKQIKEKLQPNLLDIDGYSCHHIHNVAKKFTKHFDAHLELLFINIYNDFKWSENLRDFKRNLFSDECKIYLSETLRCNTLVISIWSDWKFYVKMFNVNIVFYYSFLNADDKNLYRKRLDNTFNRLKVSQEAKTDILKVQSKLGKKKIAEDGSNRKKKES